MNIEEIEIKAHERAVKDEENIGYQEAKEKYLIEEAYNQALKDIEEGLEQVTLTSSCEALGYDTIEIGDLLKKLKKGE